MTTKRRAAIDRKAIRRSVADLRPEIEEALQALVRAPSHTGNEGDAQAVMERLMRDHGLEVDVWEPDLRSLEPFAEFLTLGDSFSGRPNVVGRWRGGKEGRSLILNGHIDTVEIGDRQAWDVDPLAAIIADGRLYGRGACDMKGGLVANLFALRALLNTGINPNGNVIVESTISEEDGGAGALSAVLRGYVADGAMIAEPTNLSIVPAQAGSLMFQLDVPGLSAHACVRDEGVSAIEKFAYLQRGLLDLERRRNEEITHPLYANLSNKAPINIGTIRGGAWPSSVPEEVVVEGRAGLVPGEDLESFKARFSDELATWARGDRWLRDHPPRLTWLNGQFAAADVPTDHPLVTVLSNAVSEVTSSPPQIAAVTYGADMRHFIHAGGMPCVMFGAGDVRLAHAPNESIAIDELLLAVEITASFIADWCGTR
jgi:acetylornithine deacetylase